MYSTVQCAQHLLPERISVLFCQKKLLIFEQPSLLVIRTAAVADYHIKVTIFSSGRLKSPNFLLVTSGDLSAPMPWW